MKTIKCYFLSCRETVEIEDEDDVILPGSATTLAPGATFGHADYARVPFLARDEHKLSGKPWFCPYHETMLIATLRLTDDEEKQRVAMVANLRAGRMLKRTAGWYEQAAPKPLPKRIIREDNGDIRQDGLMMRWWSQEEMIAALTPDPSPTNDDYKVFVKDPPPEVEPEPEPDEASDG